MASFKRMRLVRVVSVMTTWRRWRVAYMAWETPWGSGKGGMETGIPRMRCRVEEQVAFAQLDSRDAEIDTVQIYTAQIDTAQIASRTA